jgi:hypothetical protein
MFQNVPNNSNRPPCHPPPSPAPPLPPSKASLEALATAGLQLAGEEEARARSITLQQVALS